MPQETLRNHPLCRAEDLGKPIPPTKHAISMCLPRWRDVVGYEKRDPATMEQLQQGYPRFFCHPLVAQAFSYFGEGKPAQIYTTRAAAERCKSYLLKKSAAEHSENHGERSSENPESPCKITLREIPDSSCVLISYPESLSDHAKDYWQHAGEGISSRCAEALLNHTPPPDASESEQRIIERIAGFTGTSTDNVYLFPSGMAAIHAAFLMVREINPSRPTVQYAFPYGDTLKLQNKLGSQPALFYPHGDTEDLQALEAELQTTPISGLFCEFPTNPLLTCVDLSGLRRLADQHRFPIIIDETLGACINQNTLPVSDLAAISLTKFFAGTGDVMGGALIVNPDAPFATQFKNPLARFHEPEAFHPTDIIQMETDSRNCRERVEQINRTALGVCEFLNRHPAVAQVFYPAFTDKEMYDRFRRPDGGYGGLFSFVLKDAAASTEAFYDALEITKGPNLGTSFSLCCPFTLIAHYDELEWAESAGASRHLIRISAGMESPGELIERLERALRIACT